MLTDKRILVVEAEFLIALEIQRILQLAGAPEPVFARSIEEAAELEPRFSEFDLAIVATGSDQDAAARLIAALAAASVAVVAASAGESSLLPYQTAPDVPHVNKPFGETELLTACAVALATMPATAGAACTQQIS